MATLITSGTSTFEVNDILRLKDNLNDEWMRVDAVTDSAHYTVTRDLAGNYASNNNPAWSVGAAITNYGIANSGGIFLTASETNSPYLEVFTHAGSPWSETTERARLGNLTGIAGASGYGLWTNNGFFTGTVSASTINTSTINTSTLQTAISGQRIVIDSNTNTLKFYNTGDNVVLTIDDNIESSYPGILLNDGIIKFDTTYYNSYLLIGSPLQPAINIFNEGYTSTIDTELEIIRSSSYYGDGDDAILKLVNSAPVSTDTYLEPDAIRYYQGPDRGEYTNSLYGMFRVRYDGSLFIENVSGTAISVDDGPIAIKTANELRFYDSDNSNYVGFEAPSLSENTIWVLPTDNTAGFMYNNGSGTLSWNTTVPVTDATNTWSAAQLFQAGFVIGPSVSTNGLFDDASNGDGSNIMYIGNASINVTASDKRYKNIQGKTKKGIKLLDKLEVIDYIWKESYETKDRKQHIGLAAQDVYEINKCLAKKPDNEETGLWITSHDDLIALCIKSIQDLHKEIKQLKKENKELKLLFKS